MLIERPVYEEVLTLVQGILGTPGSGRPVSGVDVLGPVINETAADRIMGVIEKSKTEARLIHGGERLGGELADGYFISPTVFADVDNASPLARDEIFGPVVAVIPFDTEEEAVRVANDSPFGLAGYIQTSNLERRRRCPAASGGQHLDERLPRDTCVNPVRWRQTKRLGPSRRRRRYS